MVFHHNEISFLNLLQPSLNQQIILTNAALHLARTVEHVSIDTMIICVHVLMAILEKAVRQVGKTVETGLVNGKKMIGVHVKHPTWNVKHKGGDSAGSKWI